MTHQTTVTASQWRALTQVKTGRMLEDGLLISKLAQEVETSWADFPEKTKTALYTLMLQGLPKQMTFWTRLRLSFHVIGFFFFGGNSPQDFQYYLRSVDQLRSAVLGAVEREHPDYEPALLAAMESALTEAKSGTGTVLHNEEEIRAWFREQFADDRNVQENAK